MTMTTDKTAPARHDRPREVTVAERVDHGGIMPPRSAIGEPRRGENLAEALIDALLATPGQDARDLAKQLRASRSAINSVLYNRSELFRRDEATRPNWFVIDGTARVQTEPSRAGAGRATAEHPMPDLTLWPWQVEALDRWKANDHRGVIEAVTGAGKTRIAVQAIAEALSEVQPVLVLVPTLVLLNQWHERLRTLLGVDAGRLGGGHSDALQAGHVLIATLQSASRSQPELPGAAGLLVADEVHRTGAKTYARALLSSYPRRLGLTATYERNDDGLQERIRPYFGDQPVYSLGYSKALKHKVIAPFRVAIVRVHLGPADRQRYDDASRTSSKLRSRLINQFGIPASPFGEFMEATAALTGAPRGTPGRKDARAFLKAFSEVRKVTAENDAKRTALSCLGPIADRAAKTLAFSTTIYGAEMAATELRRGGVSTGVISSDMKDQDRRTVLSNFKSGLTSVVAAPLVLDEGVDVPTADLALVVAGSKTRRQMIQRMGRVLRLKPDGSPAKFVLIVAADTNEDPSTGAHADFLAEMLDSVDAVRVFEADATEELGAFLFDGADAGTKLGQASARGRVDAPADDLERATAHAALATSTKQADSAQLDTHDSEQRAPSVQPPRLTSSEVSALVQEFERYDRVARDLLDRAPVLLRSGTSPKQLRESHAQLSTLRERIQDRLAASGHLTKQWFPERESARVERIIETHQAQTREDAARNRAAAAARQHAEDRKTARRRARYAAESDTQKRRRLQADEDAERRRAEKERGLRRISLQPRTPPQNSSTCSACGRVAGPMGHCGCS